MRATLWIAFLVPVLVTQVQAEIPKHLQTFNLEKFTGFWYVLAIATDAQKYLPKGRRKMGAAVIEIPKMGRLKIVYAYDRPQGCQSHTIILNKDPKKGMFRNAVKGIKDFRVLSTDYWFYAVVYIQEGKTGKSYKNVLLYSRKKTVKKEILMEFSKMHQAVGLTFNQTTFLKQDATCAHTITGVHKYLISVK